MAIDTLEFEEQRRLRDSLAYALRLELDALRQAFTDSTDRALLGTVLMDLEAARETPELRLGVEGREILGLRPVQAGGAARDVS